MSPPRDNRSSHDQRNRARRATWARINRESRRRERQIELERIDRQVLTAEGVARYLHCTKDTVLRIPRAELPYTREGRRNLYLLEDVLEYLRRKSRLESGQLAQLNSQSTDEVIDSTADSVRRRSNRRRTP